MVEDQSAEACIAICALSVERGYAAITGCGPGPGETGVMVACARVPPPVPDLRATESRGPIFDPTSRPLSRGRLCHFRRVQELDFCSSVCPVEAPSPAVQGEGEAIPKSKSLWFFVVPSRPWLPRDFLFFCWRPTK